MGIARPVMEQYPYAWAFFILIATFTMLNLFVAIIVNAIQKYSQSEHQETMDKLQKAQSHIEMDMHEELKILRLYIAKLYSVIV